MDEARTGAAREVRERRIRRIRLVEEQCSHFKIERGAVGRMSQIVAVLLS